LGIHRAGKRLTTEASLPTRYLVKSRHHDIRLSNAEAVVLLELARRLRDDPSLADQLSPAELVVVANLVDVLRSAAMTPA
jgi:hypothetical protein